MSLSRMLFVLIGLLLLVIGIELVWLFVFQPKGQTAEQNKPTAQVSPSPVYIDQAIAPEVLNSLGGLQVFKKGVLKSAILTYTLSGKAISVKDVDKTNSKGETYKAREIILEGTEKLTNTFYFNLSPDTLKEIEVIDGKSDDPISIQQLKTNDTITITYTINLQKKFDFDQDYVESVVIERE